MQPVEIQPTIAAVPDPRGLGALVEESSGKPLPLARVQVRSKIAGTFARTEVQLRFENHHPNPINLLHLFPLPEAGALVEMELRAGEYVVRAEIRRKEEAAAIFSEAQASGHQAALVSAERDDIHTMRVSRVPPGAAVTVQLVILEQLEAVDGEVRWRFPTVIPPRYAAESALTAVFSEEASAGTRIQPPLRASGGVTLDLEVEVSGPVRRIRSSQHAISLDLGEGLRVAPSTRATLDRDFVLGITQSDPTEISAKAWSDGRHTAITVTPPQEFRADPVPRDAVFVIDVSGSMMGMKLDAAKIALSTALRGLLPGDRFRLLAFDDQVERFRPDYSDYNDKNLEEAEFWIASLAARGGTIMLPPLEEALRDETPAGRLRTVLFMTDGETWEEEALTEHLAARAGAGRVFTLGIDSAVNAALLKRMASLGGGVCDLATPGEDLEPIVARFEARFGLPVFTRLSPIGVANARRPYEDLFAGRAVTLWVEGSGPIEVEAEHSGGRWRHRVTPTPAPFALGALWAGARLSGWQEQILADKRNEAELKPAIERVALEFGLVTRYTSMVAVERTRTVDGQTIEVVQPHEFPHHWDPRGVGIHAPSLAVALSASYTTGGAPLPPPPAPSLLAKVKRSVRAAAGALLKRAEPVVDEFEETTGAPPLAEPADDNARAQVVRAPSPASVAPSAVRPSEGAPARSPVGAEMVRLQGVNGSFGGSLERTVAALLWLLLDGHTRNQGLRRRVVMKAAKWLEAHPDALAARALELLAAVEGGAALTSETWWETLAIGSAEGDTLRAAISKRSSS